MVASLNINVRNARCQAGEWKGDNMDVQTVEFANLPNLDTVEFIQRVNACRLAAEGGWYAWQGKVNNHWIRVKAYKTWLQIAECDGLKNSFPMDISVGKFKECLQQLAK